MNRLLIIFTALLLAPLTMLAQSPIKLATFRFDVTPPKFQGTIYRPQGDEKGKFLQ